MKRILVLIVGFALATNGRAELLEMEQGSKELAIQGVADLAGKDGRTFNVQASFGYFTASFFEIGILGGYASSDSLTEWNAGVFAEYNFEVEGNLVPFVGAVAKYCKTRNTEQVEVPVETPEPVEEPAAEEPAAEEGEAASPAETEPVEPTPSVTLQEQVSIADAAVIEGKAGLKYFIAENLALSVAYVCSFANSAIYWDGDEAEKTDARIELSVRFFF